MNLEKGPYSTAPGPRRRWSTFTIWAEDGLVFLFDPDAKPELREEPLQVLTCREARERLKTWSIEEMDNWDKRRTEAVNPTEKGFCNDMFFKIKKMNEVLDETIKEAVEQGDQNDPEVARKKMAEFMRSKLAGKWGTSALPSTSQMMGRMHDATGVPLVNTYRRKV